MSLPCSWIIFHVFEIKSWTSCWPSPMNFIWCGMILALCIIRVYIFNFACLTMIYRFLVPLFPCNKYWHPCQFSYLYSVHHVCWSCQTHNIVPSFFTNINPLNNDKFALGSKWNSTSQCVYMRLRTIVLLKTSFS